MASTSDEAVLRAAMMEKTAIRRSEEGYTPNNVNSLINRFYDPEAFRAGLEGKDNVFLPVPSTSGRNTIPREMTIRLQKEYGGEIISELAEPTATAEAKTTKGIEKLKNPAGYRLTKSVAHLQGKNVVIVDDFHSTGETGRGMRDALATGGVTTVKEAYLAGKQMSPATYAQIDEVMHDLKILTGCNPSDVRPKLLQYFRQRGTELLSQVANDLRRERVDRGETTTADLKVRKNKANELLDFLGR